MRKDDLSLAYMLRRRLGVLGVGGGQEKRHSLAPTPSLPEGEQSIKKYPNSLGYLYCKVNLLLCLIKMIKAIYGKVILVIIIHHNTGGSMNEEGVLISVP